jgi:hypothetical protein
VSTSKRPALLADVVENFKEQSAKIRIIKRDLHEAQSALNIASWSSWNSRVSETLGPIPKLSSAPVPIPNSHILFDRIVDRHGRHSRHHARPSRTPRKILQMGSRCQDVRRTVQRWAQYIVWTILIARKVPHENDTDTRKT